MANRSVNSRGLSYEELSGFCAQIAMMLNSGMALYDGVETLAQMHGGSAQADLYAGLSQAVVETGSLYEALKQDSRWPDYLREMTGIGERTGRLEEVMNGLATHYDREARVRRAISNAIVYPVVLGVMMLMIIIVMIAMVLPVFRRVLGNMGVEMTATGDLMLNVGMNIGWIVLAVVGALIAFVLVCCALMKTSARESTLRFVRRAFPPLGKISFRLSSARAASVLSMMLSSGFPLYDALEMTPSVIEDRSAKEQIEKAREMVQNGEALEDALAKTSLFDELHNRMIKMGCAAGCVDAVMNRIAGEYEERVEDNISNLISIIEPTLVGVLSVVVGAMLLSVMLPMAGVISSIL